MQFKRFVPVRDPQRNKLSNAAPGVLGPVFPFWSQSESSSGSAAFCFSFRRATKTRAGGKWKELVNANIAFKLGKVGYKGRMGNHPATCESVRRQSSASAAQHPTQLPRASKGVVQRDEVGSEVGSKWHRAKTMGRALPQPGELREGHLGFLQHDRRAWKDSKSWTQWGGTKHNSKWRSGALNHETRGRSKGDICMQWGGKSASERCNKTQQVRQNQSRTSWGNPIKELQGHYRKRDCIHQ